jgi:hypothetical protein
MSAVGTITIIWRGGEHQFCLAKVGEIFALEDTCRAGIMEILRRLETESWRLNDVRETIRLGLIGGGMDPERAMLAVKLHVDGNPNGLAPSVLIAHEVLRAAVVGVRDDPVGKQNAAETEAAGQASTTMTGVSAAQPSMELPQDWDGHRDKPMPQPSGNWPPASTDTTAPTAAMPQASPRH